MMPKVLIAAKISLNGLIKYDALRNPDELYKKTNTITSQMIAKIL